MWSKFGHVSPKILRQRISRTPPCDPPVRREPVRYLRLIDSCITQLKVQGPSKTCNGSKERRRACQCIVFQPRAPPPAFERTWHTHDSQGQILAFAFRFERTWRTYDSQGLRFQVEVLDKSPFEACVFRYWSQRGNIG